MKAVRSTARVAARFAECTDPDSGTSFGRNRGAFIGIGAIMTTLLVTSGSAALERIGAAQADPAPTDAVRADPMPAEPNDPLQPAAVDREWVAQVAGRTGIPERALAAYATASARMALERPACHLGWNTLAGVGRVESEHGTLGGGTIAANGRAAPPIVGIALDGTSTELIADSDGGALDGDAAWDRAVGPMQFIPSTWANWGLDGDGDGIADPQDIDDAAYSAAAYLCSAAGDLRDPGQWIAAIAAYNDTVEYNHRVAGAASHYAELAFV